MPILTEAVTQPSEQDLIDLTKIYRDDPHFESFSDADITDWVKQSLSANDGSMLYAARFNDRLLASIWLRPAPDTNPEGGNFCIRQLCVRKVTRGRGVARKLINDMLQIVKDRQWQLTVQLDQHSTELESSLQKLGFHSHGDLRYHWPD